VALLALIIAGIEPGKRETKEQSPARATQNSSGEKRGVPQADTGPSQTTLSLPAKIEAVDLLRLFREHREQFGEARSITPLTVTGRVDRIGYYYGPIIYMESGLKNIAANDPDAAFSMFTAGLERFSTFRRGESVISITCVRMDPSQPYEISFSDCSLGDKYVEFPEPSRLTDVTDSTIPARLDGLRGEVYLSPYLRRRVRFSARVIFIMKDFLGTATLPADSSSQNGYLLMLAPDNPGENGHIANLSAPINGMSAELSIGDSVGADCRLDAVTPCKMPDCASQYLMDFSGCFAEGGGSNDR
jgi:hypothetical protein